MPPHVSTENTTRYVSPQLSHATLSVGLKHDLWQTLSFPKTYETQKRPDIRIFRTTHMRRYEQMTNSWECCLDIAYVYRISVIHDKSEQQCQIALQQFISSGPNCNLRYLDIDWAVHHLLLQVEPTHSRVLSSTQRLLLFRVVGDTSFWRDHVACCQVSCFWYIFFQSCCVHIICMCTQRKHLNKFLYAV